jgi:AcrR family transcriptional regulator
VSRARRLAPDERRRQLVDAAFGVFAERPYEQVTLEAVASAAGVRRGLLYHYFPDGKPQLFAAVYELAVFAPVDRMSTDPAEPLERKLPANVAQFLDVAEADTPGWRIFREGRRVSDPSFAAVLDRARRAIARNVATNHLGAGEPSPVVAAALGGYVRFAEAVIDAWVEEGRLTRAQVEALLAQTLGDVVARARALDGPGHS